MLPVVATLPCVQLFQPLDWLCTKRLDFVGRSEEYLRTPRVFATPPPSLLFDLFPNCVFFVFNFGQAESHRVMTFSNEEDVVFFRHHMYEKKGGKEVVLHEVGPRFEMQLYQLRLGTLDQVITGEGYVVTWRRRLLQRCGVWSPPFLFELIAKWLCTIILPWSFVAQYFLPWEVEHCTTERYLCYMFGWRMGKNLTLKRNRNK